MQMLRVSPAIQRIALIAAGVAVVATAVPASAEVAPSTAAAAPAYFHTVPPGHRLPTGKQCAAWVRARPVKENKGVNKKYNHTTGQSLGSDFFSGDAPGANRWIAPRVNGAFTGTTEEILRW